MAVHPKRIKPYNIYIKRLQYFVEMENNDIKFKFQGNCIYQYLGYKNPVCR